MGLSHNLPPPRASAEIKGTFPSFCLHASRSSLQTLDAEKFARELTDSSLTSPWPLNLLQVLTCTCNMWRKIMDMFTDRLWSNFHLQPTFGAESYNLDQEAHKQKGRILIWHWLQQTFGGKLCDEVEEHLCRRLWQYRLPRLIKSTGNPNRILLWFWLLGFSSGSAREDHFSWWDSCQDLLQNFCLKSSCWESCLPWQGSVVRIVSSCYSQICLQGYFFCLCCLFWNQNLEA